MSWHERIAREGVEVERDVAADGGQVGAADATEARHDADPVGRRQRRFRHVAQLQHRQRAGRHIRPAAGRLDDGEGGDGADVLERQHLLTPLFLRHLPGGERVASTDGLSSADCFQVLV